MRWMKKLKLRMRSLWRRGDVEREMQAELQFHIAHATEENVAKGMSPEEARQAALRTVGTVAQFEEQIRDTRKVNFLESLVADVKYAIRTLRKAPVFATVAVLSLALGTGANMAIFSLIDSVLLQQLPVRDPEQLFYVRTSTVKMGNFQVSRTMSNQTVERLATSKQISGLATFQEMDRTNVSVSGVSDVAPAVFVSGDYFSVLGIDPAAGRNLGPTDQAGGPNGWAGMIGYGYWQRRFGSNANVIGQQVTVNSIPVTIVGVMPRKFRGLFIDNGADVALPVTAKTQVQDGVVSANRVKPDDYAGQVIARLKPGVSIASAQSEMTVLLQQALANEKGSMTGDDRKLTMVLTSAANGSSALRNRFEEGLQVLMAVVAIVMLIASANLASLLLTRSAARQREICIRMSLGSSRGRLVRQLLTEALVLSVGGTALGLLFAVWARNAIVKVAIAQASGPGQPFPIEWNWHLFGFIAGLCAVNALLFGAVPALKATRQDANLVLHSGRSIRNTAVTRIGKVLVGGQVALSLALVVAAALLLRTLAKLYRVDLGYNQKNVLMMTIDPHIAGYADGAQAIALYHDIRDRLAAIPGVQAVSMMRQPLLGSNVGMASVYVPGYLPSAQEDQRPWTIDEGVGPHFFATMQMPLVEGRDFEDESRDSYGKVIIINQTMAKHFFSGKEPLGQKIAFSKTDPPMEVIGVAADAHYHGVKEDPEDVMFVPLLHPEMKQQEATLLLRTSEDPQRIAPEARAAIHALSPNLPVYDVTTMEQMLNFKLAQQRILAALSGFFGLLALALSAIGLYGVLAYNVAQRTGEIGVRMALGANRGNILRMVFGETATVVGAGILTGLVITVASAKLIRAMLFGIKETDAQSIALAVLVLAGVALTAAFVPMRKAMRVDPMTALREE